MWHRALCIPMSAEDDLDFEWGSDAVTVDESKASGTSSSLGDEIAKQKVRSQPAATSATGKRKSLGASQDKACPLSLCERFIYGKNRYCCPHNRPYETVMKQALKGVKNDDPDTETNESLAFKSIFGWRSKVPGRGEPGDPEKADTGGSS